MNPPLRAVRDDRLRARVVWMEPLRYTMGANAELDRPAHVRSGSGLAFVSASDLVVVQDDASFLAWVNGDTGEVRATTLDHAPHGARQFDSGRGNKMDKLDLESCVVVHDDGVRRLLAFGSGSAKGRDSIVLVDDLEGRREARIIDASRLYDAFRAHREFSGSELNVEGVALVGEALRFFQRGNGAATEHSVPVDATVDVSLAALMCFLDAPETAAVPPLSNACVFDLGELNGVRLTFTDAAVRDGLVFFLAAAEASPNAVDDGVVEGVVLGCIDGPRIRWTPIVTKNDAVFRAKAEGLAFDPSDPSRAWVVLDHDDPSRPSELCALTLEGPWPHAVHTIPPSFGPPE